MDLIEHLGFRPRLYRLLDEMNSTSPLSSSEHAEEGTTTTTTETIVSDDFKVHMMFHETKAMYERLLERLQTADLGSVGRQMIGQFVELYGNLLDELFTATSEWSRQVVNLLLQDVCDITAVLAKEVPNVYDYWKRVGFVVRLHRHNDNDINSGDAFLVVNKVRPLLTPRIFPGMQPSVAGITGYLNMFLLSAGSPIDSDMIPHTYSVQAIVMMVTAQLMISVWKHRDNFSGRSAVERFVQQKWGLVRGSTTSVDVPGSLDSCADIEQTIDKNMQEKYDEWVATVQDLDRLFRNEGIPAHRSQLCKRIRKQVKQDITPRVHWLAEQLKKDARHKLHMSLQRLMRYDDDAEKTVLEPIPSEFGRMSLRRIYNWARYHVGSENASLCWHIIRNTAIAVTLNTIARPKESQVEKLLQVQRMANLGDGSTFPGQLCFNMRGSATGDKWQFWLLCHDLVDTLIDAKPAIARFVNDIETRAETNFVRWMRDIHKEDSVTLFRTSKEAYISALKYDAREATLSEEYVRKRLGTLRLRETGLQPFACQHASCPLYMVPRHDMPQHHSLPISNDNDDPPLPNAIHKTVYQMSHAGNCTVEDAMQAIRQGVYLRSASCDTQAYRTDYHWDRLQETVQRLMDIYSSS